MPNYQNGKIYEITNDVNDEEYVGSTILKLCQRWGNHKSDMERLKHRKLYAMMNEIGIEHFRIVLIENFPCNSVEELTAREEHWRKAKNATLNMSQCALTEEEIKKKHCDRSQKYADKNRDIINEKQNKWRNENKEKYLDEKKFNDKKYRDNHKKELSDRRKVKILCDVCNKDIRKDILSIHIKTKKHKNNLMDPDHIPSKSMFIK